ncbi:hypothetical protein DBR43_09195 [Pedobacter sp. KBW06]|uniref:hypothetical protein n=1 Tax=Pedobacter sp. KBW06 TaxID=2153359 RepID=UPI000F5AAFC4|nr:hypothetical protein [Pedobacter sp. KBW06]RQO75510.1 hypothetical protein DBR43_09195 [Pedobacter sp. KBW06]
MSVNLKRLTTLPFLLCLFLLLLNDFYLKATFHNAFTGKLSDFCGLFIFPIFWSVLFPARKSTIYILTALFFIYWKSSYSDPFIHLFSEYLFTIQRTVDFSDLFALMVLPLSWYALSLPQKRTYFNPQLAALLVFFSFCATSKPRPPSLYFETPQYVLFPSTVHLPDSNAVDMGFRIYNLDTLLVIQAEQIQMDREPVKNDDFNKNLILKDLDKRVLSELSRQYHEIPEGKINRLTIKTKDYQDHLIFRGSRLDGKFLRTNKGQILISGQFKNGIEDAVWTFNNPSENTSVKKTFNNGETVRIENFASSKLTSSESPMTRKDTNLFKGFQLAILFGLFTAIIFQLRKNHKNTLTVPENIKIGYKLLLCISLPFLSWFLQFMIWTIIPDHYTASFQQIAALFLIYVAGIPIFAVLLFWLKPRKQSDLLWYCLLLALLFVFWQEAMMLSSLLEN